MRDVKETLRIIRECIWCDKLFYARYSDSGGRKNDGKVSKEVSLALRLSEKPVPDGVCVKCIRKKTNYRLGIGFRIRVC